MGLHQIYWPKGLVNCVHLGLIHSNSNKGQQDMEDVQVCQRSFKAEVLLFQKFESNSNPVRTSDLHNWLKDCLTPDQSVLNICT